MAAKDRLAKVLRWMLALTADTTTPRAFEFPKNELRMSKLVVRVRDTNMSNLRSPGGKGESNVTVLSLAPAILTTEAVSSLLKVRRE